MSCCGVDFYKNLQKKLNFEFYFKKFLENLKLTKKIKLNKKFLKY